MLEGALDVEAPAVRARKHPRGREIDDYADERHGEHEAALHVGRVDQAAHRLEQDQQGEHEQRHAVGLGGEDLDALEAVGHHALRRARGQADGHQRERDRGRIGEHVAGVREQRERAGHQSGDDLDEHEAEDQRERDGELAAVGVGGDAVRMSFVAPVGVGTHAAFTNVTLGARRSRVGSCRTRRPNGPRRSACRCFTRLREFRAVRYGDHCRDLSRRARWTTSCSAGPRPSSTGTCRARRRAAGRAQDTGYVREPLVVSNPLTCRLILTARIEAGTPQTAITVAETALLTHLRGHGAEYRMVGIQHADAHSGVGAHQLRRTPMLIEPT